MDDSPEVQNDSEKERERERARVYSKTSAEPPELRSGKPERVGPECNLV